MNAPDSAQRLSGALLRIRGAHPFFGTLALFADFVLDPGPQQVRTAATDGKTIWINPAFLATLTGTALEGLLVHELLHAALRHPGRAGSRDATLWNIAADVVVNGMIRNDARFDLPAGAVEMRELAHLSVEEVYEQLHAGRAPIPALALVDILPWSDGLSAARGVERRWKNALHQARAVARRTRRGFGSDSLGMHREIACACSTPLDWRELLWQFVVVTPADFAGFDRRHLWRGLYLDDVVGETVTLAIAIDTSGSISSAHLGMFFAGIEGILAAYPHIRGELYFADVALFGPYPFAADAPRPSPRGGGGTSFRPFFQHIGRQDADAPDLCIYLTDGYGEFPPTRPDVPVLWVVAPGGLETDRFPFGEVARIGTDD